MALSETREQALFECLEVPRASSKYLLSSDGLDATEVSAIESAQTKILAHITAMDASKLTTLTTYLDEWITLGTDSDTIEQGSIANGVLSGFSSDPNAKRAELKLRVQVLVPAFRLHERLSRTGPSIVSWAGKAGV